MKLSFNKRGDISFETIVVIIILIIVLIVVVYYFSTNYSSNSQKIVSIGTEAISNSKS